MKLPPRFAVVLASGVLAHAQGVTDPHITTWLTSRSGQYARVFETTSDKSSGNAVSTWPRSGLTNSGGGQSTVAYADIQRVAYSTNYVYVYTTGLASYTMGNWLSPTGNVFMFWPTNRAAIHRIPRNATIPTTKPKANGVGGVWLNGVYLWENGDAQSYSTSTATVSFNGSGIWNRLAGQAEAFNFDPANGHQPSSGAYHTHINPIGLRYQLGDSVTYNSSTKTYSEATPTKHSPILGWALDGLPVYGPYGYSSPMDATSAIRRMTSGFQKRDGTNGSTNLTSTGRTTLPVWAASVQGKSTTLSSSEYGPNVNTTYPLGTFAEDYDYLGDLGKTQGVDFDLNRQNVRYCVTPEYPNGTYAYFVAIDSSGTTTFPDVINQEFFGSTTGGQGTVTSINESVTDYVVAGPAANITVTASASGSGAALSWNSAEGATYKVESSPNNSTWTTVASAVTSAGLTTTYTATASATYYRVTLTAIATYDSGGSYGTAVGKTGTVQFGTVIVAPSITTQPSNVVVTVGSGASFAVTASGTSPLTYQWQKGTTAISGATNATYSIASTQASDAGSYSCSVTNSAGSATSNAATLTVNAVATAPAITTQPTNVAVTAGTSASFTVAASGTAPLSYQWRKGSANVSGATSATYTIASTQTSDAGSYSCVVSNSAGSATSNAATLTVNAANTAPTITTQPTSASANVGAAVSFAVAASGTSPLTYQWYKGVAAIAGATSATYAIASVQATDAGSYTCVVSNGAGSATSNAASLGVTTPAVAPTITTQPTDANATTGSAVSFTVVATGTSPLAYQWQKAGVAVAGATSATLTLTNVQAANAGSYACVVSNSAGSATTRSAALTVTSAVVAPTIVSSPSSTSAATGATASFTVVANGTAPLAYQWTKNGSAVAGATTAAYTITSVQSTDAANYACTVSNSAGSVTSSAAALTIATVATVPTITQPPSDMTVAAGSAASFTVVASGTAPLSYQWYKGVSPISGATSATYSLAAAQTADAGSYTCVVSNSAGSATSSAATLAIDASSSGGSSSGGSSSGGSSTGSSSSGTSSGGSTSGGSSGGSSTTSTGSTGPLPPRLVNLSVRTQAGGAAGTPVTGFVLSGSGPGKRLLIRAIGPTLTAYGVSGALYDPSLQLWSNGSMIASNDNWQSTDATTFSSVGAFPLVVGTADAAIVSTLGAGAYTTPVTGPSGSSGVVLIECYDTSTDASTTLVNASARALVGTGDNVLIPAFVIGGEGTLRLLVRAVGPQLFAFGVKDALLDPQITIYRGSTAVATNDNWSESTNASEIESVASQVGAFPFPRGSKDAVVLITLPAGAYTAVVSGVGGTTGTALVELYVAQ